MKVRIETLHAAANACFDYMEASFRSEVELSNEGRWELPFKAAADMSKPPVGVKLDVQELEWSYEQCALIEKDDGFVGGTVETEHLGLLLRDISEKLSPSE